LRFKKVNKTQGIASSTHEYINEKVRLNQGKFTLSIFHADDSNMTVVLHGELCQSLNGIDYFINVEQGSEYLQMWSNYRSIVLCLLKNDFTTNYPDLTSLVSLKTATYYSRVFEPGIWIQMDKERGFKQKD
jgi:hypothetical protein